MSDTAVDADVVIVGSGIAGLTTARRAQQLGLQVILLDKGAEAPGSSNARVSQGFMSAAYLPLDTDPEVLKAYGREITSGLGREELIDVWAENCARASAWVTDEGVEVDHIMPGSDQRYLQPFVPGTPGLRFYDRTRGPDRAMTMYADRFVAEGGRYLAQTRATSLLTEDDGVVGVVAWGVQGRFEVRAKAVVLADGGFQANADMVRTHIGPAADRVKLRSLASQTGDGIRMGQAIGAAVVNMEWFYGHMLSLDAIDNDDLWPYPAMDGPLKNGVLVGRDGRRVADEDGSGIGLTRPAMSGIALSNAIAKTADPRAYVAILDSPAWAGSVWKDSPAQYLGTFSANPAIARDGGRVFEAPDLASLAALAGIDAEGLVAEVEAFNAAVHAGTTGELEVPRGGSPRAIETGPFYAIPVVPGLTYTLGGLLVTPDAQVRREDETPIPGLFAVGGTMGGMAGGPLGGYFGGLGEATVFGLLAAERIAADLVGARAG
ncbi:MAG: FAD-dependent oxidoreductase [Microbacteriaceae bacterium]|nr:FAD-dependent oxidoreductase [Microbacteriaceae bacterium]